MVDRPHPRRPLHKAERTAAVAYTGARDADQREHDGTRRRDNGSRNTSVYLRPASKISVGSS